MLHKKEYKKVKQGGIYAIPLFLYKELEFKPKVFALEYQKERQDFCFCRVICIDSYNKITIEVFNYVGALSSDPKEIVSSGRLFKPVWVAPYDFNKERWKLIFLDENYDQERDSKYSQIQFVFGTFDFTEHLHVSNEDLYVSNLDGTSDYDINYDSVKHIERAMVWGAVQVENRIRKAFNMEWDFLPWPLNYQGARLWVENIELDKGNLTTADIQKIIDHVQEQLGGLGKVGEVSCVWQDDIQISFFIYGRSYEEIKSKIASIIDLKTKASPWKIECIDQKLSCVRKAVIITKAQCKGYAINEII